MISLTLIMLPSSDEVPVRRRRRRWFGYNPRPARRIDLDQAASGEVGPARACAIMAGRHRPAGRVWRRLNLPRQESSLDDKLSEKIAEIRNSFEFFDKDANGLIDFDEFRALLRTVNPEATTSQAAEGFSMTDTNCDGYVDLDEFVAWWQATWWEY
jgi:hypothetical protein